MKFSYIAAALLMALASPLVAAATSSSSSAGTVSAAGSSASTSTSSSGAVNSGFMATLTKTIKNSDSYHFSPVHVVHARVQSDRPVWNSDLERFVSTYYDDSTEAYRALMDTVNTASVEGALMYVQAEGINYNERSDDERCTRKNSMTWVVLYELAITQTNETLALYQDSADQNEYGAMLPMDSGRCTPTSGDDVFPEACYYFNGDDGQPDVGPFVGGESKTTDIRAPYPDCIWYSFPNTCPLQVWSNKTDTCREDTRKGLCDIDTMPDGIECTFAYRVLGYMAIDDLVGITSMVSNVTGDYYANFSEFCENGGVEFLGTTDGVWEESIDFWLDPQNETANSERSEKLIALYNNMTSGGFTSTQISSDIVAHFIELPTIEELVEENPPCYKNVEKCNTDAGCMREKYGQLCTVCTEANSSCIAPPSSWTFPTLTKAVGSSGGTGTAGSSSSDGSAGTSGSSTTTSAASVLTPVLALTSCLALVISLLN